MSTIPDRRFLPEQSFVVPRDDVRRTDGDGNDATGAHVFLDRPRRGDVLNHPLVTAFHFGSTTTRRAGEVNRWHLVALGAIATAHQYQPFFSLCPQALHGVE